MPGVSPYTSPKTARHSRPPTYGNDYPEPATASTNTLNPSFTQSIISCCSGDGLSIIYYTGGRFRPGTQTQKSLLLYK